jgi:peroxiredoxin-like protein
MSIAKVFRYGASVHWRGGRLTRATSGEKPPIDVATPPEFKGGIAGVWSPEELLVTATASCFVVTLAAVADASAVKLDTIAVDGLGHLERASDGRFRFVAIELTVEVTTDDRPETVERLVADAERLCIVSGALDVPVHVKLVVASAGSVALSG